MNKLKKFWDEYDALIIFYYQCLFCLGFLRVFIYLIEIILLWILLLRRVLKRSR